MVSLLSFWIHKNSNSLRKCKFSIEKLHFPVYCLTQHFIRTAVLTENLMKRLFLMMSALSDSANIWADIYHDPKRLSLQVASVFEAACDIMCLKFSCHFIRLTSLWRSLGPLYCITWVHWSLQPLYFNQVRGLRFDSAIAAHLFSFSTNLL